MGDPKKQRKKYDTPRFPWRVDILEAELKLLGSYGLRNKHELWRHETMLSKFRGNARSLIGKTSLERVKMEKELLARLKRLGMIHETAALDDVHDLAVEDILERRLQTIVFRKGLARTVYQARQLITHGHVTVGKQRVTVPSYLVFRGEEDQITYTTGSPLSNPTHPLRQTTAATTTKEKPKEEEQKGEK